MANNPCFDAARTILGDLFPTVYKLFNESLSVESADDKEFLNFANVAHPLSKEFKRAAMDTSSSLKSTVFVNNFVLGPCIRQENSGLKYVQ